MLEFCQTTSPNLENYEADGVRVAVDSPLIMCTDYFLKAWPTLLDDFVATKKSKTDGV